MLEGFVRVGTVDDLKPGEMKLVEIGEKRILLANVGGRFYAVDEECTHAEGPLSEGELEGEEVECILHGSRFNVTTGEYIEGPAADPLFRYQVRIEGKDVLVGPAQD